MVRAQYICGREGERREGRNKGEEERRNERKEEG